jgi:hypothetical protein
MITLQSLLESLPADQAVIPGREQSERNRNP